MRFLDLPGIILNGTRYHQSEKCNENYKYSARRQFDLEYFGPLTNKLLTVVFTHPVSRSRARKLFFLKIVSLLEDAIAYIPSRVFFSVQLCTDCAVVKNFVQL